MNHIRVGVRSEADEGSSTTTGRTPQSRVRVAGNGEGTLPQYGGLLTHRVNSDRSIRSTGSAIPAALQWPATQLRSPQMAKGNLLHQHFVVSAARLDCI